MSENTEKTETKEVTTTKGSWITKLWSAVVGAAVAVAGMFGITQSEITTEKAKAESVKTQAIAAYEALKAGDVTTATANLKAAIATGKEVVADAKVVAGKVKEADKASIVETAKEKITKAAVADQVKKVEVAAAEYAASTAKAVDTKTKKASKATKATKKAKTETKTEAKAKTEVKAEAKAISK